VLQTNCQVTMFSEEFASDTDDDDYVPHGEGHEASEEENSGDDEQSMEDPSKANSSKKKKKKKTQKNIFGRPTVSDRNWDEILSEEKQEKEQEKQKKKADELWADFKSDTSSSASAKTQSALANKQTNKPATSDNISTLFSNKSETTDDCDDLQSSKSDKPKSRLSSLFDPIPSETINKSEQTKTASSVCGDKPKKSRFSSLFDEDEESKKTEVVGFCEPSAAASGGGSGGGGGATDEASSKVEITKVFDFAGETVKVTKKVDADSAEAKKFLKTQAKENENTSSAVKRTSGLASVVGSIGKKAKMSCLDKSKLDWNQFVTEEGIKEELSSHNRGKNGFVERQMFLERVDLRQFEIEKAAREKTRKSFMK